jgi:cytochrome c-type biogenesis protein CcmH
MILWFVLTIMTSIAAVFVSAPFIRRFDRRQTELPRDIAVYRDQLKEVDSDAALGLIDAAQAEIARTEIKRRMLASRTSEDAVLPALSTGERIFAAIGVAGIVVFGSVGLFALTGNFEPTSAASFASLDAPPANKGERAAVKKTGDTSISLRFPAPAPNENSTSAQTTLPPVEEMIQRLVTRLQRNPKDVEGWRVLGWSYFSTDHFTEAAAAYARAIELDPDSVEYRDARTDALIRAAGGVVTQEAKGATEETLKRHPKDPRARYFKGLAANQAGDRTAALKEWGELLAELETKDPLFPELRRKVEEAKKDGGRVGDASTAANDSKSQTSTSTSQNVEPAKADDSSANSKGPQPEDIRNAEAMTVSDRTAMIRRMVDSLEDRLELSPRDVDGWIKLIRSRSVLGDKEKAKQAFEKALRIFEVETPERKRITATAEELGLGP